MSSPKQSPKFPPLRRPNDEIADPGKVHLGDSTINARFPRLRKPVPEIADPGKVRLGDSTINAHFPVRK